MTKRTISLAESLKSLVPRRSRISVLERFPAQSKELVAALEDIASGKLPHLSVLHVCEVFLAHHPEITGINAHGVRNWLCKAHSALYQKVLR